MDARQAWQHDASLESPIIMFKKILVPTDGSDSSQVAALRALQLAKQLGATVVAFAVAPVPRTPGSHVALDADRTQRAGERSALERSLQRRFEPLAAQAAKIGVAFDSYSVISDETVSEIADAAIRHRCDLLFMGTQRRRGIVGKWLKPSTTEHVIGTTSIPVLVYQSSPEDCARFANTGSIDESLVNAFGAPAP